MTKLTPQIQAEMRAIGLNGDCCPHSIVIPCYNEAARLDQGAFLDYLKTHTNTRFVFVNDGSKDETLSILHMMRAKNPAQIEIVDMPQNGGKAEAVRAGMNYAAALGDDYIGFWDADLATPLEAIEDFMRVAKRMPELEVIYGARKAMLGHKIERKFSRRIVSRICATMARFAVKLPISDTQAGAKIFKNTNALRAAIAKPFTAGWLFDVELFTRIAREIGDAKGKFFEFALFAWTEIPGSKVNSSAIIKSGMIMLRLIFEARMPAKMA